MTYVQMYTVAYIIAQSEGKKKKVTDTPQSWVNADSSRVSLLVENNVLALD